MNKSATVDGGAMCCSWNPSEIDDVPMIVVGTKGRRDNLKVCDCRVSRLQAVLSLFPSHLPVFV